MHGTKRNQEEVVKNWRGGPASHRLSLLGAGEVRREGGQDVGHALARFRLGGRRAETDGRSVMLGLVQMPAQTVAGVVVDDPKGAERRAGWCRGGFFLGVVAAEREERL